MYGADTWLNEMISVPCCSQLPNKNDVIMHSCVHAGYWYVAVHDDSDVSTTIANSTLVRAAFMSGLKLPPDDTVSTSTCYQRHI